MRLARRPWADDRRRGRSSMGQTKSQLGKEPSHVRIYRRQMQSLAWRHLSGSSVKVLLALAALERGDNNGGIYLSDRKGAEMTGLSRNTVRKSLAELMERGFIYCSERGAFSRKTPHAASYGVTWAPGPQGTEWRAPSHAYERWTPDGKTRAQFLTETGSNSDMPVETLDAPGSNFGPVEMETPLVSAIPSMSEFGPHTSNQSQETRSSQSGNRKQAETARDPRTAFLDRLRAQLVEHLDQSTAGEQSRIAAIIDCPGGTLSKFIAGRNLPPPYTAPLAAELLRRAGGRLSERHSL